MYKQLTAIAALLSVVSASPITERNENPDQIIIGNLGVPRGNVVIAWVPSKTTQEQACTSNTFIQSSHSNVPSGPICGSQFSVGNLNNVTLDCATKPVLPMTSDVVAVLDSKGEKIETCVGTEEGYVSCGFGAGVRKAFVCTPDA